MPIKFRVTLTADERQQLAALISTGKAAARKLLHARILLKADQAPGGPACTDDAIVEALDCGLSTVCRVRQSCVEAGLCAALERKKPTGRQCRKLDGAQEAHLIALACSAPPEGRTRWTLKLLASKLVELDVVDSISGECVRTTLKTTSLSLG